MQRLKSERQQHLIRNSRGSQGSAPLPQRSVVASVVPLLPKSVGEWEMKN
ncbi:MAG: hypothetical protein PUP92_00410 [Rhizonema sp. PD38]|nr:hypothetical protein [Rhizonema sp. PD38]